MRFFLLPKAYDSMKNDSANTKACVLYLLLLQLKEKMCRRERGGVGENVAETVNRKSKQL